MIIQTVVTFFNIPASSVRKLVFEVMFFKVNFVGRGIHVYLHQCNMFVQCLTYCNYVLDSRVSLAILFVLCVLCYEMELRTVCNEELQSQKTVNVGSKGILSLINGKVEAFKSPLVVYINCRKRYMFEINIRFLIFFRQFCNFQRDHCSLKIKQAFPFNCELWLLSFDLIFF